MEIVAPALMTAAAFGATLYCHRRALRVRDRVRAGYEAVNAKLSDDPQTRAEQVFDALEQGAAEYGTGAVFFIGRLVSGFATAMGTAATAYALLKQILE